MGNAFGSKNATSTGTTNGTSTTTLSPQVQAAYNSLLSQIQGSGSTNGATNSATSGLTSLSSQPNASFGTAATTLGGAANPASASIGDYLSPYLNGALQAQQAVQSQQNAGQQQQLLGNAAAQGALGGNRVGVAQGQLALAQNLANNQANSGLINSAYQNAITAALQGQSNLTSAGNAQAGLGSSQNQASLGNLLGLLQAGSQPYTNLGTLAGAAQGLSNSGATISSSGNTSATVPQGNIFSQLLGGATALAGLFAEGGRVKLAGGGAPGFGDMGEALAQALATSGQAIQSANDNTSSANDNSPSGFAPTAEQKTGASNIKNWLFPQQPAGGAREIGGQATFGNGGTVRKRFANGGFADFPYPDVADFSGGIVDPDAARSPSLGDIAVHHPSAPPANLGTLFATDEHAYGLPTGYLGRTAQIESGGNPAASNPSGATGLFQFMPKTAGAYGLGNPNDPVASTDAAAQLAADNAKVLSRGLGRDPTAGELYLAHQQGAQGALNLLSDPSAPAASIVGRNAVIHNGGSPDMSAGDFAQKWIGKFDPSGQLQSVTPTQPNLGNMAPDYRGVSFDAPKPNESHSIGDVISSLQQGHGLGLSDDARYGLLAAGLGMMSSKSPFALAGVGEGGLAGLQAYQDRQKLERENAEAASGISAQQAGVEQAARDLQLKGAQTAADINTQSASAGLAKAQTGLTNVGAAKERFVASPVGMLKYDPSNPDAPPTVIPWNQLGNAGQNTPAEEPTPDADGFVTQAPGATSFNPLLFNPETAPIVTDQTKAALGPAQTQAINAQNLNTQLGELSDLARNLPQGGFLAQGSGFDSRTAAAKALNATLGTMGIAPIDPEDVASAEGMKKLATQLQFAVADQVKADPAAATIAQAAYASPSGENTVQGFQRIVGNIEALNKRATDRYNYLNDWASKHYGDLSGADAAFNAANPPQKYVEYGRKLANPAGTANNPVTPKTQADIDNAPSGTVFSINGKLMRKP